MNYQVIFILLSMLSTATGVGLAMLGFRHRQVQGGLAFVAMTNGAAIWSFFYVLEITSNDLDTILMWNKAIYVGIEIIPVAWLVFALQYTDFYRVSKAFVFSISIIPALSYLVALTNWNDWFWENPEIVTEVGFTTLDPGYGPVALLNFIYAYILVIVGMGLLANKFVLHNTGLRKRQATIIMAVILMPLIGSILRVLVLPVDIVPITFTASGLLLAFGVLNFDVLNLLPVANDMVINNMPIGMAVLTLDNIILSTNNALKKTINSTESVIGKHIQDVLGDVIQQFGGLMTAFEADKEIVVNQKHLNITISPLKDRQNRIRGKLVTIHDITDLRQAEIRYQALFDQAQDAIFIEDMDGKIINANPAASKILGYSNEELQQMTTDDLHFDPQSPPVRITETRIETSVKRADDTELLADITLAPIVADKNTYRLSILRDITAIRHTEQELKERLEQVSILRQINEEISSTLEMDFVLSLSLDAAVRLSAAQSGFIVLVDEKSDQPIPITHRIGAYPENFKVDLNSGFIGKASKTLQPVLIRDVAEVPNCVPFLPDTRSIMLIPLVSHEHFIGMLSLASTKTTSFTMERFEFLQILADRIAVALDNARLYQQIRQQVEDLQKINEQLTIMRQVNEEVSSTLKMDFVLTISLDAAARLSGAQAGFIALADSPQDQATTIHHIGPYPEGFSVNLDKGVVGRAANTRIPRLLPAVNGEGFLPNTKSLMVMPLTSHEHFIGVLCLESFSDSIFTTDNFHFLQILANRIAVALDNARLYQQIHQQFEELQKLYDQVSNLEQIKTDMIRVAAHDLGNPLAALFGYLQMFELDIDMFGDEHKEYIQGMVSATRRMLDMRDNILSLERIEQMARMEYTNMFDFSKLVAKAIDEYNAQASAKSQNLTVNITEDISLAGDNTQIYEALVNLISNAIKYTPENGEVAVSLVLDEDDNIVFTVKDTGYGIPKDLQERLFQPFYRAKTDETQGIAGTGLGLHLVKNIIERHQGEMIVSSIYGKGSTFGFKVPH